MRLKGSGTEDSYFRFDVPTLGSNEVAQNVSATLRLLNTDNSVQVSEVTAYSVNGSWSEDTLTFNNTPGFDTGTALFVGGLLPRSSGFNEYTGTEFNTLVAGWLNGETNNGIALVGTIQTGSDGFSTKENNDTTVPELVITYDIVNVPEPSFLLGMLILGSLGISKKLKK